MSFLFYNIKKHNLIRFTSFFPDANECSEKEMYKKIYISIKVLILYSIHKIIGKIPRYGIPSLNKVLIIEGTLNQRKSLSPIYQYLDNSLYTLLDFSKSGDYISWHKVNYYSCLHIPTFLFNYWFSTKEEKKIIRSYFNDFFQTIGTIKIAEKLLKNSNVKLLIMANDHSMIFRSFKEAADRCHIKTMYLQHASVTYRFPPLQFSYSFLDGMDSYVKYSKIGNIQGKVYLSGNPRFDIISKYRGQKVDELIIGIAINALDNENIVRQLCLNLKKSNYSRIIVRPHPALNLDKKWYIRNGFVISDSKTELSMEFLSKISLLISGESGIHLDSALMNVRSICYKFHNNGNLLDWYSFQANGMYPFIDNFDDLKKEIQMIDVNYHCDAKYYDASHGLKENGSIGKMLSDFIYLCVNNRVDDFDEKYGFKNSEGNIWCYESYLDYFFKNKL